MKRTLFIIAIALVCLFSGHTMAQSQVENPNNWRLSYGFMNTIPQIGYDDVSYIRGTINAEWSRNLNNYLEIGAYTGLKDGSHYETIYTTPTINPETGLYESETIYNYRSSKGFMLGMTCRLHLLPLANKENDHWDLYMSGRVGNWLSDSFRTDFGIGAGLNFFPTKHIGFFAENNWGRFGIATLGYPQNSSFQFNIGLIIR